MVSRFQVYELWRQGTIIAMINARSVAHIMSMHGDPDKFHRFAKNLFLIEPLLIFSLLAATVATGGIYFNTSRSGVQRAHIIGYSDFVIGLNGNGQEAKGLKIGLIKDSRGMVWVATCYPVEVGAGT